MRIKRKTSGQSMLEFSLMIPFLFLLVMGLFDIGRGIFYYAILNNAVREGTRYAVVQPYCDYLSDPGNCSGNTVDTYPLNCENAQSAANTRVCNKITHNYFNIGELSNSSIIINHTLSSSDDPVINISINYSLRPITPGLALAGDLPLHVESQMLMTPIAKP